VITRYLPESEYTDILLTEARKFESEGHHKEAEKMYLSANEADLAINMYKKAKMYD
jgi:intraflagellar transport protein 172